MRALTFEDLARGLRARRIELGLSQIEVDEIAGLASGYTGKIEASLTRPEARNARSLGRESLPLLLQALGCELAVVRSAAPEAISASEIITMRRVRVKNMAEIGRKGGRIWWARLDEKKRARVMKKLQHARIEKQRARRKAKS